MFLGSTRVLLSPCTPQLYSCLFYPCPVYPCPFYPYHFRIALFLLPTKSQFCLAESFSSVSRLSLLPRETQRERERERERGGERERERERGRALALNWKVGVGLVNIRTVPVSFPVHTTFVGQIRFDSLN